MSRAHAPDPRRGPEEALTEALRGLFEGSWKALRGPAGEKRSLIYAGKVVLFLENKKSNGNSIIPSFTHPLCSNFSYLKNPFLPLFVLNDVFRKMIIHDHSPP